MTTSPEPRQFYPADLTVPDHVTDSLDDHGLAQESIRFLTDRIRSVTSAATYDSPPAVMLSGGIDSMLLAAVAHSLDPDTVAVTVEIGHDTQDGDAARELALTLGLNHVVAEVNDYQFRELLLDTVFELETIDAWEVGAGLVIRAGFDALDTALAKMYPDADRHTPVFTGSGADVLFLGGDYSEGLDTPEAWGAAVRENIASKFIYERAIPDFYERVLHDCADRYINTWQVQEGVDLAFRAGPGSVRGGQQIDKYAFRLAAREVGVPEDLAFSPEKNPLQESSGFFDQVVRLARDMTPAAGFDPAWKRTTAPLHAIAAAMAEQTR